MEIKFLRDLVQLPKIQEKSMPQIVLEDDMHARMVSKEESFEMMRKMYLAMKEADAKYDAKQKSQSGIVGGDGEKLKNYRDTRETLAGDFIAAVMEKAVKMGESNACMKRIVAAPTAGSCGVIPAVLITYESQKNVSEDKMVEALFVSAGIGSVIARNASISGAEGGCQAEIGSASAMAAAAVAYLEGGDEDCMIHAAALALKGMLGLVCDPVAGLVEVPCIKRNVLGAVNAVTSAEMALAGIRSVVPPDEVVDAMYRVGRMMPDSLKETSRGGLAVTPTGLAIQKKLREQ